MASNEKTVAGVDLGSNSFHLVIAQYDGRRLRVVDKQKEMVRLAAGLTNGTIADAARTRALEALERFGARLSHLGHHQVRAVGTNTFRAARRDRAFLDACRKALRHRIEVVSGSEEARLVYAGVAHTTRNSDARRLVVDVGGGSTECIIGQGFQPIECHSLHIGCVSLTERFFSDERVTRTRWQRALEDAAVEISSIERAFAELGHAKALGTSGTIRAIGQAASEGGAITRQGIDALAERLIDTEDMTQLDVPGISKRRSQVLPGGLAIVAALFDRLAIERLVPVDGALREGLIYELIDRDEGRDVRRQTVEALQHRFRVDRPQADRVAARFERLVQASKSEVFVQLGKWAAQLHEIGLSVAYSGHHKHGAYLIEHGVLRGFTNDEQALLAALVLCHRRKFRYERLRETTLDSERSAVLTGVLLRLAVRLERQRSGEPNPEAEVQFDKDRIEVSFVEPCHPLLRADLSDERQRLLRAGFKLEVVDKPACGMHPGEA